MSKGLIDLLSILDLEPLEVNLFRGRSPQTSWQRVFGGQVIGQALVAACRTVEGRLPHSLHAYFLLAGDPKVPIIYEVERHPRRQELHDPPGQSRSSTAMRSSRCRCRFTSRSRAFDHQDQMPDVPPPEKLTAERGGETANVPRNAGLRSAAITNATAPIELRPVEFGRYFGQKIDDGRFHVWIRTTGQAARRSGDPSLRAGLCVGYDAARCRSWRATAARVFDKRIMAASLDHALWFHRPFRADEWLLYAQDSPKRARRARLHPRHDLHTPTARWWPRSRRRAWSANADAMRRRSSSRADHCIRAVLSLRSTGIELRGATAIAYFGWVCKLFVPFAQNDGELVRTRSRCAGLCDSRIMKA